MTQQAFFGRLGSIYDLLNDAEQKTARIAINAWGSNGNYGQYTADSRSVDLLVSDKNTVLPLFSVGDRGSQGASQVSAPATAKNVLAVGTSHTGTLAGTVANISSQGPSLDGRIKPDIVAPGMNICSGLAEEAKSPAGFGCATGSHADGSDLYVSLSGSVLSACETGFGEFEQGEGVVSLARSFMYAGVPSLLVSLWQVNDASTANIMKSFYHNLARNMDKASALRQAKLSYIKKAKGIYTHPAFWSPFIQLGDSSPVVLATRNNWRSWVVVGALILLGLLGFGIWRRKFSV